MPREHVITIEGKKWTLRFAKLADDTAGLTYHSHAKRPRVVIDDRMKLWPEVETVLHELAHAVLGPTVSEERIEELGRVQRRVMQMLYRVQRKEA